MEYSYVNYVDVNTYQMESKQSISLLDKKWLIDYTKEQSSNVISYDINTQGNLYLSPHFQVKEFASPDSNIVLIDNRIIWILEKLYTDFNCSKIFINSGYRTNAQTIRDGGYYGDYHTQGKSVDITLMSKLGVKINTQNVCVRLEEYGVNGIGYISPTAVHIDTRGNNTVRWFGDESKGISLLKSGYNSFAQYFGINNSGTFNMLTVKSGQWNIRSSPDVSSEVVAIVKGGIKLSYTNVSNGWAYVSYNGIKGYISQSGYTL